MWKDPDELENLALKRSHSALLLDYRVQAIAELRRTQAPSQYHAQTFYSLVKVAFQDSHETFPRPCYSGSRMVCGLATYPE